MSLTVSNASGSTVDGAATATKAFGSNVTAGNTIVVIASKGLANSVHSPFTAGECTKNAGTATIGTVTLDKTNSFDDTGGASGTWIDEGIWSAPVTGSGSLTMQVAVGDAGTFWVISVAELNSSLGSISVDATNGSSSNTGAPDSGSVTPARYQAALIGGLVSASTAAQTHTPDGAFTQIYEEENGAAHQTGSHIYRVLSSGSDSASWTAPSAEPWAASVVAYTEAGGGGGPTAAQLIGVFDQLTSPGIIGRVDA